MIFVSQTPEETLDLGVKLGLSIEKPCVFCFFGDLAAGKTTFIKGLVSGVTGMDLKTALQQVNSPTYVLLNLYEGRLPLYHFDLYRLSSEEEFFSMGFDEYLQSPGVSCIEWAERISGIMPKDAIRIRIESLGPEKRKILIEGIESF